MVNSINNKLPFSFKSVYKQTYRHRGQRIFRTAAILATTQLHPSSLSGPCTSTAVKEGLTQKPIEELLRRIRDRHDGLHRLLLHWVLDWLLAFLQTLGARWSILPVLDAGGSS
ncbi:hypothetical protein GQ600_18435 [Phytophthora cactorum]|nr:hypothetical protein GQ600_18435 [Phytophthora cactorum]